MTQHRVHINTDLPSYCDKQGHAIKAVGKHGKYACMNCGAEGYCPGCVLVIPVGAPMLHCDRHQPTTRKPPEQQ